MGRVSRYKKVKSIDPFSKNGSWKSDVGDCSTFRRVKKKSKTAIKMKEQKLNKLQRRMRGGNKNDNGIIVRKKSGGCNGYGDDDGYDLPPDGEDEFDLKDILGSIKKQKSKPDPLLDGIVANKMPIVKPSVSMSSTSTTTSSTNKSTDNKKSKKKNDSNMKKISSKANIKYDGTQKITAKTSTKEIIEACSNPKLQKQSNGNNINGDDTTTTNKQEKRKAYLAKKKQKKRKRSPDDSDNEDYQQALQSLHSQNTSSTSPPTTNKQNKQQKQHEVQQQNYTHTMIARSSLNDQVERPPTFTTLPRGAHKLLKNNKNKKDRQKHEGKDIDGDDSDKAKRIRKEQLALEAMRERVMKQYAVLRESRRSGR